MASKDYYKVLGVDKNATDEDIKKAFRKKAHELHPDKKGGDEAKFKEVNEAYQVLSDKKKREAYDRFGNADFAGFPGGGNPFGGAGFRWRGFRERLRGPWGSFGYFRYLFRWHGRRRQAPHLSARLGLGNYGRNIA
jgi:DnaJ-class molecular chaperone